MKPTKIVVLDGHTLNPGDLSWENLHALGQVTIYPYTEEEEFLSRSIQANIIVSNKFILDAARIKQLPQLKCICVSATGVNNVDITAAKARGIVVSNVAGYSTPAVAQHVFALLFSMTNQVKNHHDSIVQGDWAAQRYFSYTLQPLIEVTSLTMGIYGFGQIGQAVAKIALCFGMKVLAHHKHPERDAMPGVDFVTLEELFSQSNVISLHAPLNTGNKGVVNDHLLSLLPKPAYLINTARGGLVDTHALKNALIEKKLQGAALDVLDTEPPKSDHPLIGLKNCLITPHISWATVAARQRLLDGVIANIHAFKAGNPANVVT